MEPTPDRPLLPPAQQPEPGRPLTVEEAKNRLRELAANMDAQSSQAVAVRRVAQDLAGRGVGLALRKAAGPVLSTVGKALWDHWKARHQRQAGGQRR